ncbi:MAG: hypothetical protein BIFFINMI_03608 [Phycisphaerae bacterium]|nr:hypothetical protein [Phycisphaerae bacterium]
MADPTARLVPNEPDVAARVIDGEAILINVATGVYYSLDPVGSAVWQLIEAGLTPDQIARRVSADCDVELQTAAPDVKRLLDELLAEGLVRGDASAAAAAKPGVPAACEGVCKCKYSPPTLNVYRDMQDLLALDPPMPGLGDVDWDAQDNSSQERA